MGTLYRATIEYDGTNYHGFQIQVGVPTVQGVLEEALAQLTGQRVRVVGAGRTDAGVHASGQVISFTAVWPHGLIDLHRAMNAVLPADIAVKELALAPSGFHARFSARARRYVYRLYQGPVRSPLLARYAHHLRMPVDWAAVQEATTLIRGVHDFAAFGRPPQGRNTVREVLAAEWRQVDGASPAGWFMGEGVAMPAVMHCFDITANAFLQGMVRALVGTMLDVGQGRLDVAGFARILASRDRSQASPPAPACGLCLVEVQYA